MTERPNADALMSTPSGSPGAGGWFKRSWTALAPLVPTLLIVIGIALINDDQWHGAAVTIGVCFVSWGASWGWVRAHELDHHPRSSVGSRCVSACCSADIRSEPGPDFIGQSGSSFSVPTCWFVCTACGAPCNIKERDGR